MDLDDHAGTEYSTPKVKHASVSLLEYHGGEIAIDQQNKVGEEGQRKDSEFSIRCEAPELQHGSDRTHDAWYREDQNENHVRLKAIPEDRSPDCVVDVVPKDGERKGWGSACCSVCVFHVCSVPHCRE